VEELSAERARQREEERRAEKEAIMCEIDPLSCREYDV
jgi:hypothetical protein